MDGQSLLQLSANALAVEQAKQAARQADAAWAMLWAYVVLGAGAIAISALIAALAVLGPLRERWTRDLESRIARVRINRRAGLSCSDGLRTMRSLEKWLDPSRKGMPAYPRATVLQFRRRCSLRANVIRHYMRLDLRDKRIIETSWEIEVLLSDLIAELDGVLHPTYGEDGLIPGEAFALISQTLANRAKRRAALLRRSAEYADLMEAREASLEQDLDEIWSWRWLLSYARQASGMTDRD